MRLSMEGQTLVIEAEPGDRKHYGIKNAAGESALLYELKGILNGLFGFDFVKKRMWKDGHLVDEMQQYLRERDTEGRCLAIYNPRWSIEGAEETLNRDGRVTLAVVDLAKE